MRGSTLLLIFLFSLGLASGQTPFSGKRCLIKGNVISYKTKENIEARVVFQKEPDAALTVVSLSGPKGYKANLFERGQYLAIVSAEGYVSEQQEFNLLHDSLAAKEEVLYNFELVPIRINELIPFYKILFDISSSVISPGSAPELLRLQSMLEENPSIKIQLEGHTDNAGNSRKSIRLAKRRIEAVKKWLTDGGIATGRIKLKAIGGGKSATEKVEKDTRRANRRVEIRVIQL